MNSEIEYLTTHFFRLNAVQKITGFRDFSDEILKIPTTFYQETNERHMRDALDLARYRKRKVWMGSGGWVILNQDGMIESIFHSVVNNLTHPAYGLRSLLVSTIKASATQTALDNGYDEFHSDAIKFLREQAKYQFHIGSAKIESSNEIVGVSGALIGVGLFELLYGEGHPHASVTTAHLRHDQGLADWWYAHALGMLWTNNNPNEYLTHELDDIECEQ